MTAAELRALAKHVTEEAPSDALDDTVALAVGWERRDFGTGAYEWKEPSGSWHRSFAFHPSFLFGLDAAASLMPEGWKIRIKQLLDGTVEVVAVLMDRVGRFLHSLCVRTHTEPQARVAAALLARAADMEASDASK
jgi:hypothetical protein